MNTSYLVPEISKFHFINFRRRYFFFIMSLIFFFGFGEEVSWGQRFFEFETPEFMVKSNTQGEFTIHNLELFDGKDMKGVPKDSLIRLFTMKQLFLYSFFSYLFIMPLFNMRFKSLNSLFKKLFIPIASIDLGWLFVGNFAVYFIIRIILQGTIHQDFIHGITEIQEFNFSIILLLLPLFWLQIPKRQIVHDSNIRID